MMNSTTAEVAVATAALAYARSTCFFGDITAPQAFAAAAMERAQGDELMLFNVNSEYESLAVRLVVRPPARRASAQCRI